MADNNKQTKQKSDSGRHRTSGNASSGSPLPDGPLPKSKPVTDAGRSSVGEVSDFVRKLKSLTPASGQGRGRLVFAMDATMSRQPTWDMALAVQSEMFEAVRDVGGLDVQLVYFRGAGQCRASKWVSNPDALKDLMTSVSCQGGFTQIGKVLKHVRREAEASKVNAVVYVGDSMEEDIDAVCGRAGELALVGVPVFLFQEGTDPRAERAFREIARLAKGAWCRFGHGSAAELRQLLEAVAVYAAGGRKALLNLSNRGDHTGARRLIADMTSKR